ncbi:MAG: hypothetical protein H6741_32975 [Alphaproteobacteria bacterium]|nr:hypothetical protein [Alphaproteobacteria bacterium]
MSLLDHAALAQIRSLGPEAALEAAQQAVDLGERIKNPFHPQRLLATSPWP